MTTPHKSSFSNELPFRSNSDDVWVIELSEMFLTQSVPLRASRLLVFKAAMELGLEAWQ